MERLGEHFRSLGHHEEARSCYERLALIARELNVRETEGLACGVLGQHLARLGRFDEAIVSYERSLAILRQFGGLRGRWSEETALVHLGSAWLALGALDRAKADLETAVAPSEAHYRGVYERCRALHLLAAIADEGGDPERARRLLEETISLRRLIRHEEGLAESLLALGDLCRRSGDPDGARAAIEEAVWISEKWGSREHAAVGLAILARLPEGDAVAAEAALTDIREAGNAMHARFHLWRATKDRAHLEEAKRLLDGRLANVAVSHHEPMRKNLRVHREILAAWEAAET